MLSLIMEFVLIVFLLCVISIAMAGAVISFRRYLQRARSNTPDFTDDLGESVH